MLSLPIQARHNTKPFSLQIDRLEVELSRCNVKSSSTDSVPGDYVSTKHQLLAVQSQLEKVH